MLLLPVFFAAVLLSHAALLRLPYFWDEGGYYIPAALDFYRSGTLIPHSTLTNAHPPLPSILLAAWWKIFGLRIVATRVLICLVSATGLVGVFGLARGQLGTRAAIATTLLTAIYPIWFAQSTLAHADIFAAAFTIWALVFYLDFAAKLKLSHVVTTALLFSLAALAKETAIVTPLALAAVETTRALHNRSDQRTHWAWLAALIAPALPLAAWYAYHRSKTGFVFGNPEFLRYNATANLDAHRILLSLYHRLVHLLLHMNMFVPVLCAAAALFVPIMAKRRGLGRNTKAAILVILLANALAFSILGGALLTRYLLPLYPLVVLLCVTEWQRRVRSWGWLAAFSGVAFVSAIWANPPYPFAPEDNLTYRDMIVLHQQAIATLTARFPAATVLTAWPATAEISRPELGYTAAPFRFAEVENFSLPQIERAAADPGAYDTALLFSTKWAPLPGGMDLSRIHDSLDMKYFDFHRDLRPREAAEMLHGEIVWQAARGSEWAALLRFPRIVDAAVRQP